MPVLNSTSGNDVAECCMIRQGTIGDNQITLISSEFPLFWKSTQKCRTLKFLHKQQLNQISIFLTNNNCICLCWVTTSIAVCFQATQGLWQQPSYLNSKLFGLTETGQACPYTSGGKQLLSNYNFFHWRTRNWQAERTDKFGIVCLFGCYTWGEILITLRISAVSVDNEVILLWERWYRMGRLRGQAYPLWDNHLGRNPTSAKRYYSPQSMTRHNVKEGSFLLSILST